MDEIEALTAIYGSDMITDESGYRYVLRIRPCMEDDITTQQLDVVTKLEVSGTVFAAAFILRRAIKQVDFPEDYPSSSPPVFHIRSVLVL